MEIDFQKEICIKQFIINCGTIALQFNQSLEIIWESVEFKRQFSEDSLITIQDYFVLNDSLEQTLKSIKNCQKIRGRMLKSRSNKYYYMSTLMIVSSGRHFCSLRKLGEPMGTINYLEIVANLQKDLTAAEEFSNNSFKFLANMSHEIRTPINGIVGMLSLLSDTLLNEKQLDYVETARDCCNNLLGIINDVLDFTKLEANKVQIKKKKFCLRECVDSSIDVLNYKASQKGLCINLNIDKGVPTHLISDFKRLRQILVNLLSNAVKFTNSGYIYVTISANNIENDIFDFIFNVRDTGIGIKKKNIEKIFTNYGQLDNNCVTLCGTGLGLAISTRLCTLLDGKISCISTFGKGTTFKFNIRAKCIKTKDDISYPNAGKLIGKKILIVDDNEINRLLLMTTILKWSAQIIPICCSSGDEALRYIKQMDFDIGLIDILMPNMNGFQLAKKIKKINKNLPLIALSSLGEEDIRTKRDSCLFEYILYKPVNEKKLLKACDSLFGKSNNIINKLQIISKAQSAKVIIAEDIIENQKVLKGYLNNFGYTDITMCKNGLEALDKIREIEYDILFLDIKMPVMGGIELAELLHKSTTIRKIPYIIALTANVMGEDKFYFLNKCKMDSYLTKPIDKDQLYEILQIFHNPVHVV
jgi:signal transduction histidine kinase/DNA-binding response OmpR family regulator|tara:strand:- start:838 stop:2766 length:1929 start_codon:yes stop_codon:yes gene_type:complete